MGAVPRRRALSAFYGPLTLDHVVWAQPLPLGPEGHVFPDGFA